MSKYEITVDGETFSVEVGDVSTSPIELIVNGERKRVTFAEAAAKLPVETPEPAPAAKAPPSSPEPEPTTEVVPAGAAEGQVVRAPMPGKILSLPVSVGSAIAKGDTMCTLEAMKMEMPISAMASGTVQAIHVQIGDTVAYDDPLVTIG